MTYPSEPGGQPPHAQAPGPYGPPPPQHPGRVPDPRPAQPGQAPMGQGPMGTPPPPGQREHQEWTPPQRTEKGLFGALLDANFNHLVTPKLIRLCYIMALLLITLQCLIFLGLGLWIATWDDWWAWGIIMAVATPIVWLFELLMVRILMEAVVVRFKGVEHLRVIKDKI
ncbi:DUF4282 domain-containing protein [Actinomadura rugatobispora]|uniref:DUF4282 domain-containing protein n=1 Tax=Actinomadura rugatobispora TaxID=1994 RepID=A0ABW1AJ25_9ACTN|nr:hypothetical protein GCM10010200_061780 [Actinomadura rugatobispora]